VILFRAGLSFRIDVDAARRKDVRAQFAIEHPSADGATANAVAAEQATLAFRRWWAERQPEARRAAERARGLFVIDVSHAYWRNGAFLLTFDEATDAQRFALTFLGRDQAEYEAMMMMAGTGEEDRGSG